MKKIESNDTQKAKSRLVTALAVIIMVITSCQEEVLVANQFLTSVEEEDGGQDFYYNNQKRVILIDQFVFFSNEKTITQRVELNYANDKLSQIVTLSTGFHDEAQIAYDESSRISQVESTYELMLFSYPADEYIKVEIYSKEESKLAAVEKWYMDDNNRIIRTESKGTDTNSTETVEYSYTYDVNLFDNLGLSSIEYKLIYETQVFLAQEVKRTVTNQAGDEIYKSHYYYEPNKWENGYPARITERFLDETNTLKVSDNYALVWSNLLEE